MISLTNDNTNIDVRTPSSSSSCPKAPIVVLLCLRDCTNPKYTQCLLYRGQLNARYNVSLLLLKRIILLFTHQTFQLFLVRELNLGEPTFSLGTLVYHSRLVSQHIICFGYGPRHGAEDIGGALDRLNGANSVTFCDLEAYFGELDVDDVAESFRGIGRYSDRACNYVSPYDSRACDQEK